MPVPATCNSLGVPLYQGQVRHSVKMPAIKIFPPKQLPDKGLSEHSFEAWTSQLEVSLGVDDDMARFLQDGFYSRVMLIFEDVIFFIWNHPFYCSVRCADFKNVFVFKIGPILVVRIKI